MCSRIFIAALALFLALSAPAYARSTLDSFLPQIRAQHPGRLSDAQPWMDSDGNMHYRIKWMTPEGRILYFDADTRTGRYSSAGGDDSGRWHDGSGWRQGREPSNSPDDQGVRHFRDDNSGDGDGDSHHGGEWHGRGDSEWQGGGNWHGRDNGNWRARGGIWGNWRGGHGGDNGGHHYFGN